MTARLTEEQVRWLAQMLACISDRDDIYADDDDDVCIRKWGRVDVDDVRAMWAALADRDARVGEAIRNAAEMLTAEQQRHAETQRAFQIANGAHRAAEARAQRLKGLFIALTQASSGGRRLEVTTTDRGILLALMDGPVITTATVTPQSDARATAAALTETLHDMTQRFTTRDPLLPMQTPRRP